MIEYDYTSDISYEETENWRYNGYFLCQKIIIKCYYAYKTDSNGRKRLSSWILYAINRVMKLCNMQLRKFCHKSIFPTYQLYKWAK